MRAGRAGVVAALLATVTVLAACVSPAIDAEGYRHKVGHSAQQLVGILGTARLAAQLDLRGKMLGSVTDTVITDAENDASSVLTSFESVQPPDAASVKLRSSADDVLQAAVGDVSDLRIAMRRGDASGMHAAIGNLTDSIQKLTALQDQA